MQEAMFVAVSSDNYVNGHEGELYMGSHYSSLLQRQQIDVSEWMSNHIHHKTDTASFGADKVKIKHRILLIVKTVTP